MSRTTVVQKDRVFFQCRKCEALLFFEVTGNKMPVSTLMKLAEEIDCPECGEEAECNWILQHVEPDEKNVYN